MTKIKVNYEEQLNKLTEKIRDLLSEMKVFYSAHICDNCLSEVDKLHEYNNKLVCPFCYSLKS